MVEKFISNFVHRQFPQFYRDDYPVFIAFVQEYFKWLETEYPISVLKYAEADQNPRIDIKAQSPIITTTNNDNLENYLSNGDVIAIFNSESDTDYRIYTIDHVANSSAAILTPDATPQISIANTRFSETKQQKNPLHYSRHFYENMDVDTTADEFLVHFKEKYLKNIQFTTNANIRQLIKHALDIYRSKGTERAADLLFKIVFGVGATVYYPSTDIFRLSDGKWYVPRYLEVSLKEANVKLINRQIQGINSGATAFVESVVRKTVRGRLIDVLYISAINGQFQTGEIINSSDSILASHEQPSVIGSLTTITLPEPSGTGYQVGDIVDVESASGERAKGRVSETANTFGLVQITLDHGGYAYSNTSEVMISESAIGLTDVHVPPSHTAPDYFGMFDDFIQSVSSVEIDDVSGSFTEGDEVYSYLGGNVVGHGRVISSGANTLLLSMFSGQVDSEIYTTGNASSANVISVVDDSSYANVFARSANIAVTLTNVTGTFNPGEEVYQTHPVSGVKTANATLSSYIPSVGSNGSISTVNSQGVFRCEWPITGALSGATANAASLGMTIGVKDVRNQFISTPNNYAKFSSGIGGSIRFISDGSGAHVSISPTLDYTEAVDVYTDFLADYKYLPLTHVALSGTVDVSSATNEVIGTGTSFDTEIRHTITGFVDASSDSNMVLGTNTSFTTDIACNDIIQVDSDYRRVREIANDTCLFVNAAFTTTQTHVGANVANYFIFDDQEARRVVSITNATHMVVDTAFGFDATGVNVTTSWGFDAKPEANLTNSTLSELYSTKSLEIGKVFSLASVSQGTGYNYSPFIRIYEPFTHAAYKQDVVLNITSPTSSFAPGELVTQGNNGARGLVKSGNNSVLIVERLRFHDANNFTETIDSNTLIVGTDTGSEATVVSVDIEDSDYLGFNARINTQVAAGQGAMTSVEVVDSGFGFREGETLTISKNGEVVYGNAHLGMQGKGTGFYKTKGGFLSDQKKLFDGLYYQTHSYEIRSSVTLNRYEEMLKQLLHVAGTKYFGAFVFNSEADCEIVSRKTRIISE